MEFREFVRKLPTTSTIHYDDPLVFREWRIFYAEGLNKEDVELSVKKIRACNVHTKLIRLINTEATVNPASTSVIVCKKDLHYLMCWIGDLQVEHSRDFIPILLEIYCLLPVDVRIPISCLELTFNYMAKSAIQTATVKLVDSLVSKHPDLSDHHLERIRYLRNDLDGENQ